MKGRGLFLEANEYLLRLPGERDQGRLSEVEENYVGGFIIVVVEHPPKLMKMGMWSQKKTYHATGHSSKHSPGRVKGRGTDPLYMHAKIVELRGITEIQI